MIWLFAAMLVLAMAGIAMLAAGRGEPLQEAEDDRPGPSVPADGELTAEDLRRVRFPLAFRGYRMAEVDDLLDRLAREREQAARPEGQTGGEKPWPTPEGRGDEPL